MLRLRFGHSQLRLLFSHRFGTAHGLRDGTDALFVRLTLGEVHGLGEVTLPPYVHETVAGCLGRYEALAAQGPWEPETLLTAIERHGLLGGSPALRAAVHSALLDLLGRSSGKSVRTLLRLPEVTTAISLMTIGICAPEEVPERLAALPASGGLKLKVGDPLQASRIQLVMRMDPRPVLLDGNQGFGDLVSALASAQLVGDRLLGVEQPFPVGREDMGVALSQACGATVYGDESIQDAADLERFGQQFGGVNLKLMKCGGLDRAMAMVGSAERMGLRIMLGSMSESALGCTAMAQLAGKAAIVDLDGPWLLRNDPFQGIRMMGGRLVLPDGPGLGVEATAPLSFTDFGA